MTISYLHALLSTERSDDSLYNGIDNYPIIPLNSPEMPQAGPDFTRLANLLIEDKIDTLPDIVEFLYKSALYQDWFSLDVTAKGQQIAVQFIPGHNWNAHHANGPRDKNKVMIIGKMPGKEELREKKNLVGKSGNLLHDTLCQLGSTEHSNWYVTNLLKFNHPLPQGGAIARDWIKDCLPLLHMELRLVLPDYILCLGSEAGKELLGAKGNIKNSIGKVFDFPIPIYNTGEEPKYHVAKLMTCIHSAAVAREPSLQPQLFSTLNMFVNLVNGEDLNAIDKDLNFVVAETEEDAVFWINKIYEDTLTGGAIAVDCEWHGHQPGEVGSWLRTIQLSHHPKFALCLVVRQKGGAAALSESTVVRQKLNLLFKSTEDRHVRAIGHFHRADLPWLQEYGVDLRKAFEAPDDPLNGWELTKTLGGFDTGAAAHAYCETDDYKLEVLAARYTGIPRYDSDLQQAKKDLCKKLKIGADDLPGYGDIPSEVLYPYAMYDALATRRLYDVFNGVDNKIGLLDYDQFGNNCRMPFWISMRASPACYEIERTGLLVDMKRAEELIQLYVQVRQDKLQYIRDTAKWPTFNHNSPFDCRELLFGPEYRGQKERKSPSDAFLCYLKPVKPTQGKKSWDDIEKSKETSIHSPSTDKETCGNLFHTTSDVKKAELVGTLRDLKFIGQLLKTTLKPPVISNINGNIEKNYEEGFLSNVCSDGRIHTTIYQTLETRRWSSSRPNLTNISKRREADYKRILGDKYKYTLRSILCAPSGHVLIECDYTGAELAGMAWMSGDPTMTDHVRRAQLPENHPDYYDIHSAVAVAAFKLPCTPTKSGLKSINKEYLRVAAKNVVFGYAYGRGAEAIARQAKEEGVIITVAEAQALIDGLVAMYPYLPIFFDKCKQRANNEKWICNAYGSIRRAYQTMDFKTRSDQEREFQNYNIQSLIADAMSRSVDHLYTERNKRNMSFKIALQIHDAVLLEVPISEIEVVYDDILPLCMSKLVPIYACDLNGCSLGFSPNYLGIDREVYIKWGDKITEKEAIDNNIPLRFAKKK